jgi:hypothetical protein
VFLRKQTGHNDRLYEAWFSIALAALQICKVVTVFRDRALMLDGLDAHHPSHSASSGPHSCRKTNNHPAVHLHRLMRGM